MVPMSIPAGNLKAIRTPARVGTQGNDLAFMSELRSFARMPGQQQAILTHDAIDALVGVARHPGASVPGRSGKCRRAARSDRELCETE